MIGVNGLHEEDRGNAMSNQNILEILDRKSAAFNSLGNTSVTYLVLEAQVFLVSTLVALNYEILGVHY